MLTVKQIAERAGVGVNLVYAWCADGELRHFRLGATGRRGKILVAEDDWVAFLEARRVGTSLAPEPSPPSLSEPTRLNVPSGPLRHLKIRSG